jgi:hypothetical protein
VLSETIQAIEQLDKTIEATRSELLRLYGQRRSLIASAAPRKPVFSREEIAQERQARYEQAFRMYLSGATQSRISKLLKCSARDAIHKTARRLSRPESALHELHQEAVEFCRKHYPLTRFAAAEFSSTTCLDDLPLSIRTSNCLQYEGIKTLEEAATYTRDELLDIPNFGRKSLNELAAALYTVGLSLAGLAK